jgi:glycosyltransferase involved in cell wall biosynthesis
MSNVYFLGQKGQTEVADYVAALDVGLLPYELNIETENISPLKMYEYLALGLPVVSTAIPAALRHRDIVDVADCDAAFESLCQIALVDEGSDRIEERLSFAAENTWDHRVLELTEIISGVLHQYGE